MISINPFTGFLWMVQARLWGLSKAGADRYWKLGVPDSAICPAYLLHDYDKLKCCCAPKRKVVFQIMHTKWDSLASLFNN